MAEDLLDYWVRLIKTIFPATARINSRFSNDDHLIQIDWKLQDDWENPARSLKKIEIIIRARTIEDYLDKDEKGRESSDNMMKEFIRERYKNFMFDTDIHTNQYASTAKWLISSDVLNCKPSV